MTDSLHQEPERDQFKSESPIRAFTNWTVQGRYALGKGFRPSLAHVIPYLNAMEAKEGWQIVQVLEADTQTPSFLFRQSYVVPDDVLIERLRGDDGFKQQVRDLLCPVMPEIAERTYEVRGKITLDDVDAFLKDQGFVLAAHPDGCLRLYQPENHTYPSPIFSDDVDPASRDPLSPVEAIGGDDPINSKHYGGTACAEIGELLSANSYQVLKYNWRLGEKDNPCIEIGKSIWYLEREIALIHEGHTFIPGDERLPDHTFFDLRLEGRSEHTVKVARSLISWNRYGNPETLKLLLRVLQNKLDSFNGCEDWDRGRGFAI